jgi:glycosyltransferase involved in cell wall biosynthesis
VAPPLLVLSEYASVVTCRPEAEVFVDLRRAGFPVTVMTWPESPYIPRFQEAGVRVVPWHPRRKLDRDEIGRLRSELRDGGHAVAFAFNNKALGTAVWAARGLPVKLVAYRGFDGNLAWWDPTNYLKLLHPRVDAYWCNAESVRETVRRNLFAGKDRAVAISKGHDPAWYDGTPRADLRALGVPAGAFSVACVGEVRPSKAVPDLLEATRFLPPELPVHLLLAGPGTDAPGFRRLVARSPMAERIHLLGFRPDALQLMAACDAYALPSRWGELLTRSLVEAMCVGVPPVITDLPGNREVVIDGECGRVVPPGDPRALAAALEDLARDPARARALGAAARAHIGRRWSHARTVEQVRALVLRLAGA